MNLDELERLLEAATPGPWLLETVQMERGGTSTRITDTQGVIVAAVGRESGQAIVAAVNSLPALIAAARRSQRHET